MHPSISLIQLTVGATFNSVMTRSGSVTTTNLIGMAGYVTLTDCCVPRDPTVKLSDVTCVHSVQLIFADGCAVELTTDVGGLCIYPFDGRLRFEGDGSSYSGFVFCRIEPDDGYVPFSLLTHTFLRTVHIIWLPLPPGVSRACPR